MKKLSLLLLSFVLSGVAFAGQAYKCTVKQSYEIEGVEFIGVRNNWSEFVIDRVSGDIYGVKSGSFMPFGFEVLSAGDRDTAFRALLNDGWQGIDYLVVKEYVDSKEKPFVYFSEYAGVDVKTGFCVHY